MKTTLIYLSLFFGFSILGFVFEVVLKKIQKQKIKTFLSMPWHPIYGVGLTFMFLICSFSLNPWISILIIASSLILLEYIGGLIFNVWLKMDLWNYSRKFLNLQGQICLSVSIIWTVVTGLFVFFAHKPLAGILTQNVCIWTPISIVLILFIYDNISGICRKLKHLSSLNKKDQLPSN